MAPAVPKSIRARSLAFGLADEHGLDLGNDLCEDDRAAEDEGRRDDVSGRERVLEVEDGENERDELPQGHDEGHGQRCAFCRQDEHAPDTDISGGRRQGIEWLSTCHYIMWPLWLVVWGLGKFGWNFGTNCRRQSYYGL